MSPKFISGKTCPALPGRNRPQPSARRSARSQAKWSPGAFAGLCPVRSSPLKIRPHVQITLRGPDAGGVDAAGLVIGAGDVEGQAMLVHWVR